MDDQDIAKTSPQWEHYIEFIDADVQDPQMKDFLASYYPGQKFSKYATQATLPRLNEIGAQGWKLVQMQPVWEGKNGLLYGEGEGTNTYFCVFRRPVRRS